MSGDGSRQLRVDYGDTNNSSLSCYTAILAERYLFHRHIFCSVGIGLQLIHVQHQYISLHLQPTSAPVSNDLSSPPRRTEETHIHQAKTRRGFLPVRPPRRAHGSRRASWIHKELPLQLVSLKLVGSPPQQHVDIHVPRRDE